MNARERIRRGWDQFREVQTFKSNPSMYVEIGRLREARDEALFALVGEAHAPPNTTLAQMWLRTTLPTGHPNYIPRAAVAKEPRSK